MPLLLQTVPSTPSTQFVAGKKWLIPCIRTESCPQLKYGEFGGGEGGGGDGGGEGDGEGGGGDGGGEGDGGEGGGDGGGGAGTGGGCSGGGGDGERSATLQIGANGNAGLWLAGSANAFGLK